MRKWAFIYSAAAIAVVGCGGTGNGGGKPNTTKGTTSVGVVAHLTSNTSTPYGAIEIAYLTGQGRAPGDLTAVVQRVLFDDNYGEVSNPLAPQTDCPLVGYEDDIVHLDVPFSGSAIGATSRIFTAFNLDFLQFNVAGNVAGSFAVYPEPQGFPMQYKASIRVFPGRTTTVPVMIDDSMFALDVSNPAQPLISFTIPEQNQFLMANGLTNVTTSSTTVDPQTSPIPGFLSDYIAFSVQNVANKPVLLPTITTTGGQNAAYVFFSGDVYGVSDGSASGSNFEALTLNPNLPIGGYLGAAGTLAGPNGGLPHAGTYNLLAYNPTDLYQIARIVAGQGIWYDHSTVLTHPDGSALGAGFYVVTLPSGQDNNMQEMVAFVQDGSTPAKITQLYFGYINMDLAGSATNTAFYLYPVSDIMNGAVNGQLTGSIGALFSKTGATTNSPDQVHSGTFTFDSGSAPLAKQVGFSNGTFYVYRL